MTAPSHVPTVAAPVDGPWRHVPPARRRVPHSAIARRVFRRITAPLPLRVTLPDGTGWGDADGPELRIRRADFFHRLGADGVIGFGEAYMVGDWDTDDDLAAVLTPLAGRTPRRVPAWFRPFRRAFVPRQPTEETNTRAGARSNIRRHYDLSNELFALFLDESMTYSSAIFAAGDTLEAAQARKIDTLLDATGVGPGTRLLEIGTGWGALAVRAAQRGAHVRTITISTAQQGAARRRAAAAGAAERVDVDLCDYRDVEGTYDAVVSVEMIEAVGDGFWPDYFRAIDRALAPGGVAGIQAILQPHERFLCTRDEYTWVNKYIFPGGVLPTVPAIESILARDTGLRLVAHDGFAASYAATLREWRRRFRAHDREVEALGFDAHFRRMWEFYLAFCEAAFATGTLDVAQLVLRRGGVPSTTA